MKELSLMPLAVRFSCPVENDIKYSLMLVDNYYANYR
jgi:hypothetical protein